MERPETNFYADEWIDYADHLENTVAELQASARKRNHEVEIMLDEAARDKATIVMMTSKVLDGGHTGEYRPIPRYETEDDGDI